MSWKRFFLRNHWDNERKQELEQHLQLEIDENLARGMSLNEAESAAHRKLGNSTQIREEVYRFNSLQFLETIWQDLKIGARMLRKSPTFTVVAVLTLGIGIGANAAMFSIADWLLFQQLPVRDPKSLVYLGFAQGPNQRDPNFSYPEFQELKRQSGELFSETSAMAFGGVGDQSGPDGLTFNGKTERAQTIFVTGNFFSMLGLQPYMGRLFSPLEGTAPMADPVVVVSYEYWQSRFYGDTTIIGKPAAINGHPVTIVGVAPKGFVGVTPALHMQVFLPLGMLPVEPGIQRDFMNAFERRAIIIVARAGTAMHGRQSHPLLTMIGQNVLQQHPRPDEKIIELRAIPLRPPGLVSGQGVNPLPLFAGLVLGLGILVLLLACLNVSNLLLVRSTARAGEMAMRSALGAPSRRLVRQMLTESLLLAALGCAAGIALGLVATRVLAGINAPTELAIRFDLAFDWRVYVYLFAAATLTGIIVGIVPALRLRRANLAALLHDTSRGATGSRQRLRNSLVVIQVAGSLALLIVAGLFVRSLQKVRNVDLGFEPRNVLNITLDPNQIGMSKTDGERFYTQLLQRVRALPGIHSASLAVMVPMGDTEFGGRIDVPGFAIPKGQPRPSANYNAVSADYFDTIGMHILNGRDITESDSATSDRVAVINQAMAHKYWPASDPIGHEFSVAEDTKHPIRIIGVVRNSHMIDAYSPIEPMYFVPLTQRYMPTLTLQVKTPRPPAEVAKQIETLVEELAPTMPVYGVRTMSEALDSLNGLFMFRIGAALTGALGSLGLVLAIIGVYGVMSYSVSQRTSEIGVRIALGAQKCQILALLSRQGVLVIGSGLLVGILITLAASKVLQEFLIDVSPTDALTYIGLSAILGLAAFVAMYLPASRAARIDPVVALRRE
jgi:predicted permease